MISFDEAVQRVQDSMGLERGPAIQKLYDAYQSNDPEIQNVEGIGSGLAKEYVKGFGARGGTGLLEGLLGPVESGVNLLAKYVPGGGYVRRGVQLGEQGLLSPSEFGADAGGPMPVEKIRQNVESQYEPVWGAEGVGEIAGSVLPFMALEKTAATAIPQLAGEGWLKARGRGAVAGGLLGFLDTGSYEGTKRGAIGGAVIPPIADAALGILGNVVNKVSAKIGEKLPDIDWGSIFSRSPREPIPSPETDISGVAPMTTSELLGAAQQTVTPPAPEGPSEHEQTMEAARRVFSPPEETPGFQKTAEQLLTDREAASKTHVGTVNIRTGQPFVGERTIELQPGVFVNANHPAANLGVKTPIEVENPLVMNVHDNPYKDALEQVAPDFIQSGKYDTSGEPDALSREVLGRYASRKGYDSVVLRASDPANDIILDFRDFKPARVAGIGPKEAAQVRTMEPSESVFVSPKEEPVVSRPLRETPVTPAEQIAQTTPFAAPEAPPEEVPPQPVEEPIPKEPEKTVFARIREPNAEQLKRDEEYRKKVRAQIEREATPERGSLEYLSQELEKQQAAEKQAKLDRGEGTGEFTAEDERGMTQEQINEKAQRAMLPKPGSLEEKWSKEKLDYPPYEVDKAVNDVVDEKIDAKMAGQSLAAQYKGGPYDVMSPKALAKLFDQTEVDPNTLKEVPVSAKKLANIGEIIQEWDRAAGHEPNVRGTAGEGRALTAKPTEDVLGEGGWIKGRTENGVTYYDNAGHGGVVKIDENGKWEYNLRTGTDLKDLVKRLKEANPQDWTKETVFFKSMARSPKDFGEDPFMRNRAIRSKGKIYEGDSLIKDFHATIRNNEGLSAFDEEGYVGHDGKFYTKDEFGNKVAAYVRRYGMPQTGEKVNFSEMGGGFASKARELSQPVRDAEIVRGEPVETSKIIDPETGRAHGLSTGLRDLKDFKPETVDKALREALQRVIDRRNSLAESRAADLRVGDRIVYKGEPGVVEQPPDVKDSAVVNLNETGRRIVRGRDLNTYNLSDNPDDIAKAFGAPGAKEMAWLLRLSKATPLEALKNGINRTVTLEDMATSGMHFRVNDVKVSPAFFRDAHPDLAAAIETVASRWPRLATAIEHIGFDSSHPKFTAEIHAITSSEGYIKWNKYALPGTPLGDMFLHESGVGAQEYLASIFEHELTHVAQYWATLKEGPLTKTFNVPDMFDPDADRSPTGPVEQQAYGRGDKLKAMFRDLENVRRWAKMVPEDVQKVIIDARQADAIKTGKPYILRKINKLKGLDSSDFFASKAPELKPEDMDAFDAESRALPIDAWAAPKEVISQDIRDLADQMHKYGLKWFPSFRPPYDVSDHPGHTGFIARVNELANERQMTIDKFNEKLVDIFKDSGFNNKAKYDEAWEAVEGLKIDSDGNLHQTFDGVTPEADAIARRIRTEITDPAHEYITNIDRRVWPIFKDLGLEPTEANLGRVKLLQMGLRDQVKNPLLNEFAAAGRTQGLLNFDESNDIRSGYVDGYITHQPVANERTELLNQIDQADKLGMTNGGYPDVEEGQINREAKVKRLEQLEIEMAQQRIKDLPARDVLPKHQFSGPINASEHPGNAEVLVDKNIPHIMGRYVDGIASKRFFDQVLHEFRKVKDQLPASVRDYDLNYINNLRGIRGYREDTGLVNFINGAAEKLGLSQRVSLNDVRRGVSFLMQMTNLFKLGMTPVRFPAVLLSHLGMTTWPVSGTKPLINGLAYFLAKPKEAIMEAMNEGVVEKNAEFLRAIDEVQPSQMNQLLQIWQTPTKWADYFRKTVSYHTFRLQAEAPDFVPNTAINKLFVKDVPGRTPLQMAREYARTMTDTTQFRLGAESKAQAFVGGTMRRLAGQFKQWPVNLAALYKNVARSGDAGMQARTIGALWFFGGIPALAGGDLVYNLVRNQLLNNGIDLPKETGFQQVTNQMGLGEYLGDINVLSMGNPIGLPSDKDKVVPWLIGPAVGQVYDLGSNLIKAQGDSGAEVKAVLNAVSPQLRAAVDAGEEWRAGGAFSSAGRIEAQRNPASMIIRGLDLSPSIKAQRYQYKQDIIRTLKGGNFETAGSLFKQAQAKGIVFTGKDAREIRAQVKGFMKQQSRYETDPEALLR